MNMLHAFTEIGNEQAIVAHRPDHYRLGRVEDGWRFMEHFGLRLVIRENQLVRIVCCVENTKFLPNDEITP